MPSGEWSRDRVMRAAAEWVWVPEGATRVTGPEYELVRYPDRYLAADDPAALVVTCRDGRPTETVLEEVGARVRGWGLPTVDWWVSEASSKFEAGLAARGIEVVETVRVLAHPLRRGVPGLAVPAGATAEVVADEAGVRAAVELAAEGWAQPEPTEAELAESVARIQRDRAAGDGFTVLGMIDGRPVAGGGCELVDGLARLYGAVTLPAWRGRGAYRAVLAERLRLAAAHGASLALVKGRVTTSGPILQRAGFVVYGEERRYRLTLTGVPTL